MLFFVPISASLFQVLAEFGESRKVVSLKEGNFMVELRKDAFGIQEYFQQYRMCVQLLTKTEPC